MSRLALYGGSSELWVGREWPSVKESKGLGVTAEDRRRYRRRSIRSRALRLDGGSTVRCALVSRQLYTSGVACLRMTEPDIAESTLWGVRATLGVRRFCLQYSL